MGVDEWTRTPFERKHAERAKAYEERKRAGKTGDQRSLADKAKDRWNGEHKRCHCGCGKAANAFRDGKMYSSKCVGRGSGWDKSKLPQDRTPPLSWKRKRELDRSSRELSREQ